MALFMIITLYLVREKLEPILYDLNHKNEYVADVKSMLQVLHQFEQVGFNDLPESHKKYSKMNDDEYKTMVKEMKFYKISKKDLNKKICGKHRIKKFFSKDGALKNARFNDEKVLYWGINQKVLEKFFELKDIMEEKGYSWDAISINSGHRTPIRNEKVGGASKSKHIVGEAIDMRIGDIDKSGSYTEKDKEIVLKLCEKYVIKDEGGLGKYPGTRVIHMDVRGYKARWDSY